VVLAGLAVILFLTVTGCRKQGNYPRPSPPSDAARCLDTCRQVHAEVWLWSERYGCLCLDAIDYPTGAGKVGL